VRKGKKFTIYTIVTTLGEEVALVAVVRWGLPLLGINIPWWGLALMMAALAVYAYITYWLCQKALCKKAVVGSETLVGIEGKTMCSLAPKGYVQVHGELWKAVSADAHLTKDEEVIVVGVNKLTLLVTPLHEGNRNSEARG